jgi:hypothetical protein
MKKYNLQPSSSWWKNQHPTVSQEILNRIATGSVRIIRGNIEKYLDNNEISFTTGEKSK